MKKIEFIKMHIYILVYIFIYPKREPKIPFFLVVVIGFLVVIAGRCVVVAELKRNKKRKYLSNQDLEFLLQKLEGKIKISKEVSHKNGGK